MSAVRLMCSYCGEEIEDWEEVFIKDKRFYHKICFSYEIEFEYYNRAEDLKGDLSFGEWWERSKNDSYKGGIFNKT